MHGNPKNLMYVPVCINYDSKLKTLREKKKLLFNQLFSNVSSKGIFCMIKDLVADNIPLSSIILTQSISFAFFTVQSTALGSTRLNDLVIFPSTHVLHSISWAHLWDCNPVLRREINQCCSRLRKLYLWPRLFFSGAMHKHIVKQCYKCIHNCWCLAFSKHIFSFESLWFPLHIHVCELCTLHEPRSANSVFDCVCVSVLLKDALAS